MWYLSLSMIIFLALKCAPSEINIVTLSFDYCSVQFFRSVVSNSLRPHGLQHARPSCPSPTPRVYPNSCPLSRWCHPAISSSIIPFSSCTQSLPASESFPMSQLFAWKGQNTGVSALASFLPKDTQDWSPLDGTYDLNQIPYDYTVKVRNRFKVLDLIKRSKNCGQKLLKWLRRQGSRPSLQKEMQ